MHLSPRLCSPVIALDRGEKSAEFAPLQRIKRKSSAEQIRASSWFSRCLRVFVWPSGAQCWTTLGLTLFSAVVRNSVCFPVFHSYYYYQFYFFKYFLLAVMGAIKTLDLNHKIKKWILSPNSLQLCHNTKASSGASWLYSNERFPFTLIIFVPPIFCICCFSSLILLSSRINSKLK